MDLDRQAIERRDFPIGRRGYETAAVDAHLRALAAEFEEIQRAGAGAGAEDSLAATAGHQVQSIISAAETAAAEIERDALDAARRVRQEADRNAQSTREEAVQKAHAHAAAVSQAAAALLERVAAMDAEASALAESLRGGATRLAADLSALEAGMGELYDSAGGRGAAPAHLQPAPTPRAEPEPARAAPLRAVAAPPAAAMPATAEAVREAPAAGGGDLDGARLIALNMALNGEPRAETERYLAENFELADRMKLVEEVYAAIEG